MEKSKDFSGSNTDAEVIAIICNTEYYDEKKKQKRKYNISRNTYYKYKKDLLEEWYEISINKHTAEMVRAYRIREENGWSKENKTEDWNTF